MWARPAHAGSYKGITRGRLDETAARQQEILFSRLKFFKKIPGKHQEVIRSGGPCLCFGYNGYAGSHGDSAPLVRIPFCCRGDQRTIQAKVLEDRVPLGWRPINIDFFPPTDLRADKTDNVTLDTLDEKSEVLVGWQIIQSQLDFLLPNRPDAPCSEVAIGCISEDLCIGPIVSNIDAKTAPVDVIQLDVDDLMSIPQIPFRPLSASPVHVWGKKDCPSDQSSESFFHKTRRQ